MRKKWMTALLVLLALSNAVFIGLWRAAEEDSSDVRALAQAGAAGALQMFREYRETGEESCWQYAVADFRSFQQAYYLLVEGTSRRGNYTFCNEVYGQLVLTPERSQRHVEELIEAMALLAEDVADENGYLRLAELRNDLMSET